MIAISRRAALAASAALPATLLAGASALPITASDPVLALGLRLGELYDRLVKLDGAGLEAGPGAARDRIEAAITATDESIDAVERQIVAAEAESLAGALIQVALAYSYNELSGYDDEIERLLRSALRVLARSIGFNPAETGLRSLLKSGTLAAVGPIAWATPPSSDLA